MARRFAALVIAATMGIATARADPPRVATDVAPVHSLAAQVMEGVGKPKLLIRQGASPHGYSLRPSEAQALQDADLVFWVSEGLTPWFERSRQSLAPDAQSIELLASDATRVHAYREGPRFSDDTTEASSDHAGDDEFGHSEHDHRHDHGHDHGQSHGAGDQSQQPDAQGGDHGSGHAHSGKDPHAWLDPHNAKAWLDLIAARLAEADPANAPTYKANARAGKAAIDEAVQEVDTLLEPVRAERYVVFHDAYQYYERAFDIPAAGAISLGDASDPSAARVEAARDLVAGRGVSCVYAEPQYNPGLVATVLDGTKAGTAVIDPLGTELELGPSFYPALLRDLGRRMAACF